MSGPRARRSLAVLVLGLVLGLGACGGGDGTPHDAAPDMRPSTCGADAPLHGEMLDWDSGSAGMGFCGVLQAKWTVRGDATRAITTAQNGRVEMCLAHQAQTIIDVTPPAGASQCSGLFNMPMNTYPMQATAIVPDAVVTAGGFFSARAMIMGRIPSMETQIGHPLAADHGQLYVHVDGTARQVSISASHDATQRSDGTSWAAGDTGSDVFFPNVAIGASPVAVSVAGGAVGTGSFTLEAGKMTYLTVVTR